MDRESQNTNVLREVAQSKLNELSSVLLQSIANQALDEVQYQSAEGAAVVADRIRDLVDELRTIAASYIDIELSRNEWHDEDYETTINNASRRIEVELNSIGGTR